MTTEVIDEDRDRPACITSGCSNGAVFYVFHANEKEWLPICSLHAECLHPSLEIHSWQSAGLLKPVELGPPDEPPSDPVSDRAEHFRREIHQVMGWS